MDETTLSLLVYVGTFLALFAFAFGYLYFKKKYNIKDSDLKIVESIVSVLAVLANKSTFKYSGNVALVAKYVLVAIETAQDIYDAKELKEKKDVIRDTALAICKEKNVVLDAELETAVNEIIDVILDSMDGE